MDAIKNLNIKRLFSDNIYRRGVNYYKQDLISGLVYDRHFELWSAVVHGTEDYFVEINTADLDNGILRTRCECPAYATYDSCKHVVAVLLAIANQQTESNETLKYNITDQLIDAVSKAGPTPGRTQLDLKTDRIPMKVEYTLKQSGQDQLELELKTGAKRLFVVKDIRDFLDHVRTEPAHYPFTKTFTYTSQDHYFLQQDQDIFKDLNNIVASEQMYQGVQSAFFNQFEQPKRSILIPPYAIYDLLAKLADRDLKVITNEETFEHVTFEQDQLPLHFNLKKNEDDDLVLDTGNLADAVYFPPYELLFYQGVFYTPDAQQANILKQMEALRQIRGELPISHEQTDTFLSSALPTLNKLGTVNIDDSVSDDITQKPLRAKLFLELANGMITGQLEYHYGEYRINPFGPNQAIDAMIIRDMEQENDIMQLVEQANFHFNGQYLYIELDEDDMYVFLYDILPVLENHVELYLTSEVRNLIVENEPIPSTEVRVDSATNLLEIGFDISGVNDDEITDILNAVVEKKRYYRMKSGALLSLESDEFQSVDSLLSDLNVKETDIHDGRVELPVYRSTQVDELMQTSSRYDPSFQQLLDELKNPENQVYDIPDNLQAELRSYQETGFQWFKSLSRYHLGGILADDMGLGKTLQTICYLLSEPKENPHLIVVPSSVVYNWKSEFNRFAPDMDAVVMTGTPEERWQKVQDQQNADVWITSYGTLRQDVALYEGQTFQTMILDEAQYIKNYATKTSRAIRQIKAGRRFALTGTPIENSIDELWAIFQVILPGLMPSQRTFRQMSHEKVASMTKPFILRRLKKDVLTELPDKIETVHVSELTTQQRDLYLGYLRQLQQETAASLQSSGGFSQNRMKILAGLTRLRQICCHPSLFMENYTGQSGKLEQLLETIQTAQSSGRRMLIFSQFTSMHEIIMRHLDELNIDYFYLHGGTDSAERVDMSERFNAGEKDVFLISLKAGGTGLNLTGADTVILYDLWWNPAVEDQAAGRAHRFGQQSVVQVIRMVAEGTIEEKIYDLQQKKRALIDQVIQPGETMLSSLSEDDVKELLNL